MELKVSREFGRNSLIKNRNKILQVKVKKYVSGYMFRFDISKSGGAYSSNFRTFFGNWVGNLFRI